jgi:ATP-dependent DNA helicase RecG
VAAFRFARLPEDADLLERARALAGVLLEADPDLAEPEHALLGLALEAAHGEAGRLAIPA